ncbi:MAG: hypothetical protein AB1810_14600 [Pseudomonadota bacterium]
MNRYVAVLVVASLSGCATNPSISTRYVAYDPMINNDLASINKAEIRIIRGDAFLQKLAIINIIIDGNVAASLKNNSSKSVQLDPGNHRIESKMSALDGKSGCGIDIELKSGEIVYVSASPSSGGAAIPIVSVLTNPMVCKFELKVLDGTEGEVAYRNSKEG